jgi:hypothetical protein
MKTAELYRAIGVKLRYEYGRPSVRIVVRGVVGCDVLPRLFSFTSREGGYRAVVAIIVARRTAASYRRQLAIEAATILQSCDRDPNKGTIAGLTRCGSRALHLRPADPASNGPAPTCGAAFVKGAIEYFKFIGVVSRVDNTDRRAISLDCHVAESAIAHVEGYVITDFNRKNSGVRGRARAVNTKAHGDEKGKNHQFYGHSSDPQTLCYVNRITIHSPTLRSFYHLNRINDIILPDDDPIRIYDRNRDASMRDQLCESQMTNSSESQVVSPLLR